MQTDRVAIFGSGGQLGGELKTEFAKRGHQVTAFERVDVDITNASQVEQCLAQCDPAIVLNAARSRQNPVRLCQILNACTILRPISSLLQ